MKTLFNTLLIVCAFHHFVHAQVPVMNGITGPSAVCSAPSTVQNTFIASATNGPTNYVWSVLPAVINMTGTGATRSVVFPNTNLTYTLYCYATNTSGSSNTSSFVVTVFETPTVTFSGNNLFLCQGSSTNLSASSTILFSASSSISYNWSPSTGLNTTSGPSVVASPTVTTNYVVNLLLGPCSNAYQLTVFVQPAPIVSVTTSAYAICEGETAVLTITGNGSNYSLNFVSCPLSIVISPSITTTYTVRAGKNNCETFATVTQVVDACVGIKSLNSGAFPDPIIFPNPSEGTFFIQSPRSEKITIYNELGQIVRQVDLTANDKTEVQNLPQGIYMLQGRFAKTKIVVTR